MKKSKIIVPALGILAFSTAAAVTGTVAWFTANRQATIEASAITAYNPEQGLKVTLSGAKGATIEEATKVGTGDTAAEVAHEQLRDASVDLVNNKVYGSVLNDAGDNVKAFRDVSEAALAGDAAGTYGTSTSYYWCSIYTATFELDKGDSSESYTLKYDNTKLAAAANGLAIAPALRIGIKTGENYTVVAPFHAAGSVSYVKGLTTADTDTYTALGSDKAGNFVMGTLTGTGKVVATIYTWFEGTDEACVNAKVDTSKAATVGLSFTISQ